MKKIAILSLLVLLGACASEPPPAVAINTKLPPRIALDVLTVTVLDHSNPQSVDSPYNTNNFQPTILSTLRQWAVQNLVAVGTTGEAVVVIDDASLKTQSLPYQEDMFERQQASKYIAHTQVSIHVTGREGQGQLAAEASHYATLPEEPTSLERQNAYATVYNGVINDLSAKLSAGIRSHLGAFIVNDSAR